MGLDFDEEYDESTITLTLDNDEEIICDILAIFKVEDDGQQYIALLPRDVSEEEEGEVYLYRFNEGTNDDEIELGNIEDDDEYEEVVSAFDELLDNDIFNEED